MSCVWWALLPLPGTPDALATGFPFLPLPDLALERSAQAGRRLLLPRHVIVSCGSAVSAAPTATARRVTAHRGPALRAASVSAARPGILRDNLDRARVDEPLERRMLEVVRGYLSAPSGTEMQRLPARQGDAQGLPGLVGDGRHRRLLLDARYLPTLAGVGFAGLWLSCFDLAAAALCACAALFCFWPRSFDLGDLSPTGFLHPTAEAVCRTIAGAPAKGKRNGNAGGDVGLRHELLDGSDLLRLQVEVVDAQVLRHVGGGRRPRERRHADLEREAEDHLRHGAAGPRRDLVYTRVPQHFPVGRQHREAR